MEMHEKDDELEIDIRALLFWLKKKLWIIVIMGAIGAASFGVFSAAVIKPVYTSSTMLYILNKSTTLTSLADLQLGTQLTKDYKVLVTSRPVTSKVIENLDLNLDHEELLKKVEVENPIDTRILTISVEDTDPYMAKTIADEFAKIASERMAEIMDTTPPNIVEEGYVPVKKTSPNILKNTVIGGIVTAFVVMIILFGLFISNDSIKTPEDVEKYLGLNTLGTIPRFDSEERKRGRRKKKVKRAKKEKRSKEDKSVKEVKKAEPKREAERRGQSAKRPVSEEAELSQSKKETAASAADVKPDSRPVMEKKEVPHKPVIEIIPLKTVTPQKAEQPADSSSESGQQPAREENKSRAEGASRQEKSRRSPFSRSGKSDKQGKGR